MAKLHEARDQKPAGINILKIELLPIIDSTGFPIKSDRAPLEQQRNIDWQYTSCPFRDSPSRMQENVADPKPMSDAERRRLSANYPQIMSLMDSLRSAFIRHSRGETTSINDPLNVEEMRKFLQGLKYLPHYLVQRAQDSVPARRGLAPEIILLSNAVSGTTAALELSFQPFNAHPEILDKIPDPQRMLAKSESSGNLIGDRTFCVASPDMMIHFFTAIIEGAPAFRNRFDYSSLIDTEQEISRIIPHGEEATTAYWKTQRIKDLDAQLWQQIEPLLKQVKASQFKIDIGGFVQATNTILSDLFARQAIINEALGRQTPGPKLDLTMLKEQGCNLPSLARSLHFR